MAPRQRNITASTSSDESDSSSFDSDDRTTATTTTLLSNQNEKFLRNTDKLRFSSSSKQERRKPTLTTMSSSTPKTLNVTESDIARDNHDYFNIVALALVIFASGINYEFPSGAYAGDYFWVMWTTTILYFFIDLSWVKIVPICVKSPDIIVKHHIVAMMYLSAPVLFPRYRWLMGAILSVELNTWFLILRRLVYRSTYCPSYDTASPIIAATVSTLFYVTWIAIRCYLYPRVLVYFLNIWKEEIESTGYYLFKEMIFIPVHAVLCALNLKWTYDLFNPIIKRWLGTGPKSMVVQNGL